MRSPRFSKTNAIVHAAIMTASSTHHFFGSSRTTAGMKLLAEGLVGAETCRSVANARSGGVSFCKLIKIISSTSSFRYYGGHRVMGLLLTIAVSSLAGIMVLGPHVDAAFPPSSRSRMSSKSKFSEPAKTVILKWSGKSLTKMKGQNPQRQKTQMRIWSDMALLICCVAKIQLISKMSMRRPVKLRKTRALSSGICAWLVAALFIVSASLAGAQTCPSGATGCSGPVSNWDTSKVTSMKEGKSKYLTTF